MGFMDEYTDRMRSSSVRGRGSGAGIASREGLLFVQGNTAGIDAYLRDARGRFVTAGSSQTAGINYRLARELADLAVEELRSQIQRPSVSSKRLERAILDQRNIYADQFGFGVGNPSFLDFSEAKYWRAIEQGTTYFVGKKIRGVWGAPLGGGTGTGKYGDYAIPRGPYSGFGEATGQKLYPLGRVSAIRALGTDRRKGTGGAPDMRLRTSGVIEKPITPKRYFRQAWERFDMRDRSEAVIRNIYPMAERRAPRGKR